MTDAARRRDWVVGEAVIRDPTGLHARPAVKLTKLAKSFAAAIEIRAEDGVGLGQRQVAERGDEAARRARDRAAHPRRRRGRAGGGRGADRAGGRELR